MTMNNNDMDYDFDYLFGDFGEENIEYNINDIVEEEENIVQEE